MTVLVQVKPSLLINSAKLMEQESVSIARMFHRPSRGDGKKVWTNAQAERDCSRLIATAKALRKAAKG